MGARLCLLGRSPWASPPAGVNYSNQRPPAGRPAGSEARGWLGRLGLWGLLLPPQPRAPAPEKGMEEGFWGGEAGLGATPWLPGNCGRSPVLPICSVPTHPPGQASPPTPAQPRDYQGLESPWGYGEERGFRVSPRAEQEATCDLTRMARDSSWRRGQARARRCRNAFLSQPPPEMERWVAARLTESPRPSTQPHPTPRSAAGQPTVAHVARAGGRRANLRIGRDLRLHLPGLRAPRRQPDGPCCRGGAGCLCAASPAGHAPALTLGQRPGPVRIPGKDGRPSGRSEGTPAPPSLEEVNSPSGSRDPQPWPPLAQAPRT